MQAPLFLLLTVLSTAMAQVRPEVPTHYYTEYTSVSTYYTDADAFSVTNYAIYSYDAPNEKVFIKYLWVFLFLFSYKNPKKIKKNSKKGSTYVGEDSDVTIADSIQNNRIWYRISEETGQVDTCLVFCCEGVAPDNYPNYYKWDDMDSYEHPMFVDKNQNLGKKELQELLGVRIWDNFDVACVIDSSSIFNIFGGLPRTRFEGTCEHNGVWGNLWSYFSGNDLNTFYCFTTGGTPVYIETQNSYVTTYYYFDVFTNEIPTSLFALPESCNCPASN